MSATGESRLHASRPLVNRRDLVVAPDVGDLDLVSGRMNDHPGREITLFRKLLLDEFSLRFRNDQRAKQVDQ
jgi:hypothetical protein